MSARRHIVAALLSALLTSALIVLYLRPKITIDPFEELGILLVVQVAAYLVAYMLSGNSYAFVVIKILVVSAALAAFIVYVLLPSIGEGYGSIFLTVFGIEAVTQAFAWILTRRTQKGRSFIHP